MELIIFSIASNKRFAPLQSVNGIILRLYSITGDCILFFSPPEPGSINLEEMIEEENPI